MSPVRGPDLFVLCQEHRIEVNIQPDRQAKCCEREGEYSQEAFAPGAEHRTVSSQHRRADPHGLRASCGAVEAGGGFC